MNEAEALKIARLLITYFPGRITAEVVAVWAKELERYPLIDGQEGMREHARTSPHPNLSDLCACIDRARESRVARAQQEAAMRRVALPARASSDPEQDLRTRIKARVAHEIVMRRLSPDVDFEQEVAARLARSRRGEEVLGASPAPATVVRETVRATAARRPTVEISEMTPEQVARRQQLLREQAEQLEREAMADAFSVEGDPR